MTITELITLLESASEGSRELDALIACHVFADQFILSDSPHNTKYGYVTRIKDGRGVKTDTAPMLATSIDAALTLVPKGWAWATGRAMGEGFFCDLGQLDQGGIDIYASAPTAPLAICIACLRARASTGEQS